jgi:hypothetical protein
MFFAGEIWQGAATVGQLGPDRFPGSRELLSAGVISDPLDNDLFGWAIIVFLGKQRGVADF